MISGNRRYWILGSVVGACICVCADALMIAVGVVLVASVGTGEPLTPFGGPTTTVSTIEDPPLATRRPSLDGAELETLHLLRSTLLTHYDEYEVACRLDDLCDVARAVDSPNRAPEVGDTRMFWVSNPDNDDYMHVRARLEFRGQHGYFWVQLDEEPPAAASILITAFDEVVYPTTRRYFGSEWSPGVDNDPRIYVLYADKLGSSVGGYFSGTNELNPAIARYSNAAELIVIGSLDMPISADGGIGPLAHELQHLIHWNLDPNESTWLDEGASELAELLVGAPPAWDAETYALNPDLPLLAWADLMEDEELATRHYGQSYLFTTYFFDRFGEDTLRALVEDPTNGLESVDNVLRDLKISDPATGAALRADDVVRDWMVALALDDPSVGDGRYAYSSYTGAPLAAVARRITECPQSAVPGAVSQYGVELVSITCTGNHTVEFTGSTVTSIVPADAHSGSYAFWSNVGDKTVMTLTREFDLTRVKGSIPFTYSTWFDIDEGSDSLTLLVSVDGRHWEGVKTASCILDDPYASSSDCLYHGRSGGAAQASWIQDSADLFQYGGKKIWLRFEYVSSAADIGYGALVDDVSLPALNYTENFDSGDGGWRTDGFIRTRNLLPQTYLLAGITSGPYGTTVGFPVVRADQTASVDFSLRPLEQYTLLITGTQRLTRLASGYTLEIK